MAGEEIDDGRQSLIAWLTAHAMATADTYASCTTAQLRDMVASGKREIEIYIAMGLSDEAAPRA